LTALMAARVSASRGVPGVATLPAITAELIKQCLATDAPAITVADSAMPSHQSVRGRLGDIAALTSEAGHQTTGDHGDRRGCRICTYWLIRP
jgi:precorrin-4 methylase